MTDEDDLFRVTVYTGAYDDAMFLANLLQGSGISATFVQSWNAWLIPHRVVIARRDVDAAMPLIEDFKANGVKSKD